MSATAVEHRLFGHLSNGEPVDCYTLVSDVLRAEIITFGACIVSLQAPNAAGKLAHVLLGSHNLDEYTRKDKAYFGAICGRFAGRLAGASIDLDGVTYLLSANDGGKATLHGGAEGFDARNWSAEQIVNGVRLTLCSPDNDQGFPGNLRVVVTYALEGNNLSMLMEAHTDAPTVVNLTNHAYFNLDGEASGSICEHELQINSSSVLVQDEHFIPTGEIVGVEGTVFDFRQRKNLGLGLRELEEMSASQKGYNNTFVLDDPGLKLAARLQGTSGRVLEMFTSEPTVHLYTAGYFNHTQRGLSGATYGPEAGIALEAQHCPDSPHHPAFPSTVLRPDEVYRTQTVWKFGVTDAS